MTDEETKELHAVPKELVDQFVDQYLAHCRETPDDDRHTQLRGGLTLLIAEFAATLIRQMDERPEEAEVFFAAAVPSRLLS